MDHLTMRLLFPREAVLKLLEEPVFEGCLTLIAQRDVKPSSDAYSAVFMVETQSLPECGLTLRPISTTVVGTTRTASKRLIGEGFLWADTRQDSAPTDLLRAHFRAEEAFLNKVINDIGYQLPSWRNHYRNSAGDLDTVPEIMIKDPGAEDMERLFGSDLDD
jgi:hypothetical protein